MHLIPVIPGGWNPNNDGIFHIEQTSGDIIFLSAADTDLHCINNAYSIIHHEKLKDEPTDVALPSLRIANLVYLKNELSVDKYLEEVVRGAKIIICRLLGGRPYYQYLVEALIAHIRGTDQQLILLPGYALPDPELLQLSTIQPSLYLKVQDYFLKGGKENYVNVLQLIFQQFFNLPFDVQRPNAVPDVFLYHPDHGILEEDRYLNKFSREKCNIVVFAYQSHFLADNLDPLKEMVKALEKDTSEAVVLFVNNFRDPHIQSSIKELITAGGRLKVSIIVNTTSFSLKNLAEDHHGFLFSELGVPVIQAIMASTTEEVWKDHYFGLTPTDIAINVALPELDGRIITQAISFKKSLGRTPLTDSEILKYEPHAEGIQAVAELSGKYYCLSRKRNSEKNIALILPNYPTKDARLANGVGLDTPESCAEILKRLKEENYHLGDYFPSTGREIIELLTYYITNDMDQHFNRPYQISISKEKFDQFFLSLDGTLRSKVKQQWGNLEDSPNYHQEEIIIPGCLLGKVFLSIQPARGYHDDPKAIYHSPDLPPTYAYLAYYFWVTRIFGADAVVHIGKHGNLEWLPGKSVALGSACFPFSLLGTVPHFYPFIVNDPGEGTQAKRRTHAVILDHLIPPMTRAETYGPLVKLEHLIDEYYEAQQMDVKRATALKSEIIRLVRKNNLETDLNTKGNDVDQLLVKLDSYICDLKEAQIRDGLHIFGRPPEGEQLIDLLIALHRIPSPKKPGITQALAQDFQLEWDPLTADTATVFHDAFNGVYCRNYGDVVEQLELMARELVRKALDGKMEAVNGKISEVLQEILNSTFPKVSAAKDELSNLMKGLEGAFVPSGPSGAPTRGNIDILPTGRNFYSVDVRCIPTPTAYRLGEKSAVLVIERYLQEHGEYPETIGVSVWGTSTMRTGGDDIAQAFALMGVRPVWKDANRRVTDFEVISLLQLKRPRVDVTLRISGFFRDAFPDIISLFNAVVAKVATLDEPDEMNPVKKKFQKELLEWKNKGVSESKARSRALFRVFGSKPGAYGAGLQAVIDEKNWTTREDLARIYVQWGGYAYGGDRSAESAHEVFEKRLSDIAIVLQNQDNREHDILDSDDYYQFQGGMANAVNHLAEKSPDIYFGDHSRPETPRIKSLKEELLKVYRSRVINPKWIDGVKRHGYKGAFEMAATMDYLFAYDATTDLVDDFMYEGITQAYLFDDQTRGFIEENNPWALKEMTERMLESIQRGMWKNPSQETLDKLKQQWIDLE